MLSQIKYLDWLVIFRRKGKTKKFQVKFFVIK